MVEPVVSSLINMERVQFVVFTVKYLLKAHSSCKLFKILQEFMSVTGVGINL